MKSHLLSAARTKNYRGCNHRISLIRYIKSILMKTRMNFSKKSVGLIYAGLFSLLFISPVNAAPAVLYWLVNNGAGGTDVAHQTWDGTNFSGTISTVELSPTGGTIAFGGFSYDAIGQRAFWLADNGAGGTSIFALDFDGTSFLGNGLATVISTTLAPSDFGGFSYDAAAGQAYWIAPGSSVGAALFTQSFNGLNFSGVSTEIATMSAAGTPNLFGGFNHGVDSLAYYLASSGSTTNLVEQPFTNGTGFTGSSTVISVFSPTGSAENFGGLSVVAAVPPVVPPAVNQAPLLGAPIIVWLFGGLLAGFGIRQIRKQRS